LLKSDVSQKYYATVSVFSCPRSSLSDAAIWGQKTELGSFRVSDLK